MAEQIRQAELARRIGVSRAAVSAAVKAGRITPGPDGLFDSATAISEWRDNTRQNTDKAPGESKSTKTRGGQPKYASSRARKELALAQMAEMRLAQMGGYLAPFDDLETALRFFGGGLRAEMERFPDRVTPLLTPLSSFDEIHTILAEECRGVLLNIGRTAKREIEALQSNTKQGAGTASTSAPFDLFKG